MKKWFKLHKKQIFAILCVALLSLSCVTFVSAYSYNDNCPTYDYTINGIDYSSLLTSYSILPNHNSTSVVEQTFTIDESEYTLTNSVSLSEDGYFFTVTPYFDGAFFTGINVFNFYDFYYSPIGDSFIDIYIDNPDLEDSEFEVEVYYSPLGSDVEYLLTLEYNLIAGMFRVPISDVPELQAGAYIHYVSIAFPSSSSYTTVFSCVISYDTSFNGRVADIERAESNNGGGILVSLFDVFTSVTQWLVNSLVTVVSLFFVNGKFTVIGILSIIATGISIVLLLISIITAYLRFRR